MWYRSEFVNGENYFKYKGKYKNWNISATKTDLAQSLFREEKNLRNGNLRNVLHTFVLVF